MARSLDPEKNPILQVYEFFQNQGLQRLDTAEYFGFRNLKLRTVTSTRARELILLLRTTPGSLSHCRLTLNKARLMDFAPSSPIEWLDRETIEEFSGQLCANCVEALSSLRDALDAYREGVEWSGDDPAADTLQVLDQLANCQSCGDRFELDLKLEKDVLIKKYLLDQPADYEQLSSLLWYDSETFQKAFSQFPNILEFIQQKGRRPIVLFLYSSTGFYLGDFFKILSLTDSTAPISERESKLADQLAAFNTQTLDDYELLRRRHENENRPVERLDLPPSLFLQQKANLAGYPAHPLFDGGPIRSVLIYAIMAWLADKSWLEEGGTGHFMLASGSPSHQDLTLVFSSADVQREGASIFDSGSDWRTITAIVVREIGLSVGNEQLRAYWLTALESASVQGFAATAFFSSLKTVYLEFLKHKEQPIQLGDSPGFIEIIVRLDPESRDLRFELHGPGYFHQPVGEIGLNASAEELRTAELSKLARMYLSRVLVPDATDSRMMVPSRFRLETQGVDLWIKFIPDNLKRAYDKLRGKDLTIFIVSEDPAFPWELVKPLELPGDISVNGFDDMWWAVEFSIARWLSGRYPPAETIALKRICCVADANLTAADAERKYLESIATVFDLPQTFEELRTLLSTKDYDLIHFACHGRFDTKDPGDSVALLPDGYLLTPKDFLVGDIMKRLSTNRPLVFINSCHSGRTGQTLIGIEGWAREFIDRKCGAFVGCGWEVNDALAAKFAEIFYESLRGGENIGKAMHKARTEIKTQQPDNPTWLAYYLYGNPNCVLRNKP